jgi:hypothetical protein
MGIKYFLNDYKYPLLALALLLLIYGFFLQTNIITGTQLTGFATVTSEPILGSYTTKSCTSTSVSWSKPYTSPSGIGITYTVLYSTYGSSTLKATTTSTSKTLSGLPPTVPYNWQVLACPTGASSLAYCKLTSDKHSFTQRCRPTYPQATPIDCKSAKITWTAPTGGNVPSYMIARDTDSTFASSHYGTTLLLYPNLPGTSTSYTLNGLNPNTQYYVRVYGCMTVNGKALCDYTPSSYATVQTPACATPTCNIRCVSCLTLQNEDCSYSYNYEGCRSSCSCTAQCIGCNRWRQADCREVDNAACWKLCPSPYYWPTTDTAISEYFGGGHRGIDIDGHVGDAVYAITTGTIVNSTTTCASGAETGTSPSIGCQGCGAGAVGNCVKILHTDGMYSVYGHLSTVSVTSGTVLKGDTIGAIGNSGTSYGGHLHLEILSSTGGLLNPCDYLDKC